MSHLFSTYLRWEIEPIEAWGSYLKSKDGTQYLDFTSGIGVCNLGHKPPSVKKAVEKQLNQFWHVSNLYESSSQELAALKLANASGLDYVFFSNSGAEANEAAIKLARKATGKSKVITFHQSFHGRTFAAMSATGQEKIKEGYGPLLDTFIHAPFNDLEYISSIMDYSIAAVMIEVVQGEGGVYVGTQDFLKGVERLCKQYGALLIIDEIQTGIGRTGENFAYQHFQINPDIVTVAKGLASGFPIGAVIGKSHLASVFGPGSHGSTFGGNPISIAAAIATMDEVFKRDFLQIVKEKGAYLIGNLQRDLSQTSLVRDVRGMGMIIGIELNHKAQAYIKELQNYNLLVLPAGEKVIRLLPPLTASKEEMDQAISRITHILSAIEIGERHPIQPY
jgi:acetylornithine aminotransferase